MDLQAANILLQEALTHPGVVPEAKVADFGLARIDGPWDAQTANAQELRGKCVSVPPNLYYLYLHSTLLSWACLPGPTLWAIWASAGFRKVFQ